ncbi:MAG: ATP-binding cassette domain-containing protein [Bacteroidales bacterium]|nr:ATP-binding cassette domain-containing protein [Bacteroidales bacterium]
MNVIQLDNVSKAFDGHLAVDNLSLLVPKGCIYGFIGPNGSGKTTTIRMIMNILYPDRGDIFLMGEKFSGSRLDNVGYLPEERGLYKKMKVGEILKFHGELKNCMNLRNEIDYWLDRFELTDWRKKKVETLSKGMSQKLQFIATIIDRPEIIILDEPFSGLDPINAELLKSVILELQHKGATVIFSTHDMNMAEKMCDYIFMIHKGQKVLDGTLFSIQEKYGTDTIRIQAENGRQVLQDLPGIEKINDFGQIQEVRLVAGTDPQEILKSLVHQAKIIKYEIARPSLQDIFIRIAGSEGKEEKNA